MEKKPLASSPSGFTNDLFGAEDPSPTSATNGLFSSIFPAPSKVRSASYVVITANSTWEYTCKMIGTEHMLRAGSRPLNSRSLSHMIKDMEGESNFISRKEGRSIFQERPAPCPLCSSLYYGGQEDMYVQSSSPYTSGLTKYKKDGGIDDSIGNNSNGACRGDWWQGSVYY